jgi:hypothetical protein
MRNEYRLEGRRNLFTVSLSPSLLCLRQITYPPTSYLSRLTSYLPPTSSFLISHSSVILPYVLFDWKKLALPFSEFEWRIVEISSDGKQARLRPQLPYPLVIQRLNEVAGLEGWSNRYFPLAEGVFSCEISLQGVTKSCWVADKKVVPTELLAQDAVVYAAEYFGMISGVKLRPDYWVEYDPQQGILFEPEPAMMQSEAASIPEKPAGQQAIDKLIERLREQGQGLEAAKLLIRYGGYGQNPEAARELYSKLRDLLKEMSLKL